MATMITLIANSSQVKLNCGSFIQSSSNMFEIMMMAMFEKLFAMSSEASNAFGCSSRSTTLLNERCCFVFQIRMEVLHWVVHRLNLTDPNRYMVHVHRCLLELQDEPLHHHFFYQA